MKTGTKVRVKKNSFFKKGLIVKCIADEEDNVHRFKSKGLKRYLCPEEYKVLKKKMKSRKEIKHELKFGSRQWKEALKWVLNKQAIFTLW